MLSPKQKKIAAKAPPKNKIDGKDFAVLKAEKAKGRGMGLQDEKMKPGKVMKADKGKMIKQDPTKAVNPFAKRAAEAAKATKIGKIAAGVAGAALLAKTGLEKLYEKRTGKKPFTKRPKKKMGGGMMMRPIKASSGKNVEAKNNKSQKRIPRTMPRIKPEDGDGGLKKIKELFKNRPQNKMGGGMMMRPRPMGYDTGDLVKPTERKKDLKPKQKKRKKDPRSIKGPGPIGSMGTRPRPGRGIPNVPGRLGGQPVIPTPKLAVPQMSTGSSVTVKVKLGRNKPTKLF